MPQPAAVKEPRAHFPGFLMLSASFPIIFMLLHALSTSVYTGFTAPSWVSSKIHYRQIFYEFGSFLKLNGGPWEDYIKERDTFCYPLGPLLPFPTSCCFVLLLPFLMTQTRSCSCCVSGGNSTQATALVEREPEPASPRCWQQAGGTKGKHKTLGKRSYFSNDRKENLSVLQIPSHHENHLSSY